MSYRSTFAGLMINFLCVFISTESFSQITTPAEYERIRRARESEEARKRQAASSQETDRQKSYSNGNKGSTTQTSNTPSEGKYKWRRGFVEDREVVYDGYSYAYLDRSGKEIASGFMEAENFSEGLGLAKKGGYWGYIDKSGVVAIEFKYSSAESFKNGKAIVVEGNVKKEIDRNGESSSDDKPNSSLVYYEGMAADEKKGKWGFRDEAGKMVIPAIYDEVALFDKGIAAVKLHGNWGFVDKSGTMIIPNKYWEFNYLETKEKLIGVKTIEGWGVINLKNEIVVPFKYDLVAFYGTDKMIGVQLKNRWGCIDTKGNVVVPIAYDVCIMFFKGYGRIASKSKVGLINESGKVVVSPIYEDIKWQGNVVSGKSKNKWIILKLPVKKL